MSERNTRDILHMLFNAVPPDAGVKTASDDTFTTLVRNTLASFEKKSEDATEEEKDTAKEEAPPASTGSSVEEKAEQKAEKKEMVADEATEDVSKTALANAMRYWKSLENTKTAKKVSKIASHQKTAQRAVQAELDQLKFGAAVMSAACADELAKLAYYDAAGIPAEVYMEKAALAAEGLMDGGGGMEMPQEQDPGGGLSEIADAAIPNSSEGEDSSGIEEIMQQLQGLPPEELEQVIQALLASGAGGEAPGGAPGGEAMMAGGGAE